MPYRVLGISGSPVKEGNVASFLQQMVQSVSPEEVDCEMVSLARLKIKDCVHCNFCLSKQTAGHYCALKDDAQGVFEKAEGADIIILASPVYFMRTSALMAALIDRFRVFVFGNVAGGRLRNKIGVSAAVSWLRHGGIETTHLSHIYAFLTLEMIPVSVHRGISPLGASAVASLNGAGDFDPSVMLGMQADEPGRRSARFIMRRALELAALIRK